MSMVLKNTVRKGAKDIGITWPKDGTTQPCEHSNVKCLLSAYGEVSSRTGATLLLQWKQVHLALVTFNYI